MSSFRRQHFLRLIIACSVVLLILYWTHSKLSITVRDVVTDDEVCDFLPFLKQEVRLLQRDSTTLCIVSYCSSQNSKLLK